MKAEGNISDRVIGSCRIAAAVLILAFIAAFPFANVRADVVHLKDGKSFEGKFLRVDGAFIIFNTSRGKVRIGSETLKRIEIMYEGIPLCYRLKVNQPSKVENDGRGKDQCGAFLLQLDSQKLRLLQSTGKGKTDMQSKTIPLRELSYFVFRRENDGKHRFPLLGKGVKLSFVVSKSKKSEEAGKSAKTNSRRAKLELLSGRVIEHANKELRIRLQGGTIQRIQEKNIISAYYRAPQPPVKHLVDRKPPPVQKPDTSLSYRYFIPGVPQFMRSEPWKAGMILMGFAIFAGAGGVEYLSAVAASDSTQSDPSYLFFSNSFLLAYVYAQSNPVGYLFLESDARARFDRSQADQRIAGGAAFLLYIYHLYDAGVFSSNRRPLQPPPKIRKTSLRFSFRTYYSPFDQITRPSSGEFVREASVTIAY